MLAGTGWIALLAVALLIFFYAHYGFPSITAHLLAMYGPFLAIMAAKGAPWVSRRSGSPALRISPPV